MSLVGPSTVRLFFSLFKPRAVQELYVGSSITVVNTYIIIVSVCLAHILHQYPLRLEAKSGSYTIYSW